MKFSAFAFFALAAGVAAASGDEYEARIVVSGLKSEMTEHEATQVGVQAKSAFTSVFGASHFNTKHDEIQYVKTSAATTIPADKLYSGSAVAKDQVAFVHAQVGFKPFARSLVGSFFRYESENHDSDLHVKFEEELCAGLRSSGISTFANAKDCSFSFLGSPGKFGAVTDTYKVGGASAQAELILAGAKPLSAEDYKFLDTLVEASHNEAFAKYGLALASFETVADVPVGGYQGWLQQCTPCCYDDEPVCRETAQNSVTVVVGQAVPLRTGMADDIRAIDLEIANDAFETLLCTKLRNSGKKAFGDVHTCQFGFLYTEIADHEGAMLVDN